MVAPRRAIVVFARCSLLPQVVGSLPQNTSTQELNLVGIGPGCPVLTTQIAARSGIITGGDPAGTDLTAGSDEVANRLLGEYSVDVASGSAARVTLRTQAQGTQVITEVSTGIAEKSHGLSTLARIAIGVGVAAAVLVVAALWRRRYATG